MKLKRVIALSMILIFVAGSCAPAGGFDDSLNSITSPHHFSIARWEFSVVSSELGKLFSKAENDAPDHVQAVREYFSTIGSLNNLQYQINDIESGVRQGDISVIKAKQGILESASAGLKKAAERAIAVKIKDMLIEEGIYNPFSDLEFRFPPVNFRLEMPPYLLVVSPRDRIESIREVTLNQDVTVRQMEDMEDRVDNLGVSSLVVELGGFGGTFPSFVLNNAGPCFAINAVTEEFIHQYLVFTPLGFRYLLDTTGISRDYEIATINETVAGIVSKEIGAMVYKEFYPGESDEEPETEEDFDFNAEMRDIRRTVDLYLARGEIEQAEQFMEQKRLYLESNGYHIRKLNQAYFAFYGTYGDSPMSISPIGLEVKELRSQSSSLKKFLDIVSGVTSHQDLQSLVNSHSKKP